MKKIVVLLLYKKKVKKSAQVYTCTLCLVATYLVICRGQRKLLLSGLLYSCRQTIFSRPLLLLKSLHLFTMGEKQGRFL